MEAYDVRALVSVICACYLCTADKDAKSDTMDSYHKALNTSTIFSKFVSSVLHAIKGGWWSRVWGGKVVDFVQL